MAPRPPSEHEVLGTLRRLCADLHFSYAPGRASLEAIVNALGIAGRGRGASTRAAVRQHVDALLAKGLARRVDVLSPTGEPSADWFEPI